MTVDRPNPACAPPASAGVLTSRLLSTEMVPLSRKSGMKIAYLTNVYPKPSHSFIRNEIAALERQGVQVQRFSIRRPADPLIDPHDVQEATKTTVLLEKQGAELIKAVLAISLQRPRRFAAALRMARRIGGRGGLGPVRSFAYVAEACRFTQLARKEGLSHVHVHFGTNPAAVAMLANRLGGPSYSMTVHGPDELDAPLQLCLREKIEASRFTVAISEFGRAQLMRWARPADWRRIKVVRCSVDRSFLTARTQTPDKPPRRLVCVGRLSAQKGIPLLLEAAAEVMREAPFELRIIGDGELRDLVEDRIYDLGISDFVELLGWQSSSDVRAEIEAARALVLPSFAEGLPVVLMEALALGRPVIATAVAGTPELVDQRCGWLIPAGSKAALVEAIHACLSAEPEWLGAMARTGRERVALHHDPDRNAEELAALFHGALAR